MAKAGKMGQMISDWRKQKYLTLQQLADSTNLSAAYISQIEHGKVSPSIATLRKLASALGRRTVDFFIDELIDDPVVLPEKEWTNVVLPGWNAHVRQLVRIVGNKQMQPFYTVIQPGGGSRKAYSHPGEEFGLVLEGELCLTVAEKTFQVAPLSSFYYSSLLPHSWTNEGTDICRVVWVVNPPSW
ncbi:MAG: XRE family transcriptional regulator [Thermodesulfobacteriota bacterium]